uniref:Uncharacterized protein n=1 Tax=viral metagenome TaxID=1070528 RepID=A0A6C0E4F6_9ZZZZ
MRRKKEKHEAPVFTKGNKASVRKSRSQHSILKKHEFKLQEFQNIKRQLSKLGTEIIELENNKIPTQYDYHRLDQLQNQKMELEKVDNDEIEYLLESSELIMKLSLLEDQHQRILCNENIDEDVLQNINQAKGEIIDEYLKKFDPTYTNENFLYDKSHSLCSSCKNTMSFESGYLVCTSCGYCLEDIDCSGELSFKELQEYDFRPQFTYDKRSHLEDWLKRFTAKENKAIPQEILDKVILEANKERIKDLNLLTEEKVKRYLKKLNLNDYYDNVISIINRINSRPPFTLTSEVENKIKFMFQQIQEPYEKHKPKHRKNFLSYSYVLHKIFQILGLQEFAKYFPLLKSPDKLRQQDEIFKKIVEEMAEKDKTTNWIFYPSL